MISRKYLILVAMIGMLVSIDQLTKFLISNRFQLGESRVLVEGYLNLTLIHNPGAAFGLLANLPENVREPFFLLVPLITLGVIMGVFYRVGDNQRLSVYSLSMIVGGAIGNLVDRLRVGFVVDFIDLHWRSQAHFPAFNVADAAITMGVGLLFLGVLWERDAGAEASAP